MTPTIWHNPRCSKSRATLALLRAAGHKPAIRLYLQNPPSADEIAAALTSLGQPALALVRTDDALFRALRLRRDMTEAELIAAMAANPALIERPLVIHRARAAIGRPPEAVLRLF